MASSSFDQKAAFSQSDAVTKTVNDWVDFHRRCEKESTHLSHTERWMGIFITDRNKAFVDLDTDEPHPLNRQLLNLLNDEETWRLTVMALMNAYVKFYNDESVKADSLYSQSCASASSPWMLLWVYKKMLAGQTHADLSWFSERSYFQNPARAGAFNSFLRLSSSSWQLRVLSLALKLWQPSTLILKHNGIVTMLACGSPKIPAIVNIIRTSSASSLDISWNNKLPDHLPANITPQTMRQFTPALEFVKSLNISWNELADGFVVFCNGMPTHEFDFLDVSFNNLNEPAHLLSLSTLHVKSLRFCGNFTHDTISDPLFSALLHLVTLSPSLEVLNLSYNKLHCMTDEQFELFANALATARNIKVLIIHEELSNIEASHLEIFSRTDDSEEDGEQTQEGIDANQFSAEKIARLNKIMQQNQLRNASLAYLTLRSLWRSNPDSEFVRGPTPHVFFYQTSSQAALSKRVPKEIVENTEKFMPLLRQSVV